MTRHRVAWSIVVVALIAATATATGVRPRLLDGPDTIAEFDGPQRLATPPAAGPRYHAGIPEGIEPSNTHPGGELQPQVYDRFTFDTEVLVPCGAFVTRSRMPSVRSACDGPGDSLDTIASVIASEIGSAAGSCDANPRGSAASNRHLFLWADIIQGNSDAVRIDGGGTVLVADSVLRVYRCSADDHNDTVQAYRSPGGLYRFVHNDLDVLPTNTPTCGCGNGAVMVGDNSQGRMVLDGNVLAGGGYTLRLHDDMRYEVRHNVIVAGSWIYGPLSVDAERVDEWTDNRLSTGEEITP